MALTAKHKRKCVAFADKLCKSASSGNMLIPYGDIQFLHGESYRIKSPLTNNWEVFGISKKLIAEKVIPANLGYYSDYYHQTLKILAVARSIGPMKYDLTALDDEEIRLFGVVGSWKSGNSNRKRMKQWEDEFDVFI